MKNYTVIVVNVISYFFILLFFYAAINKILDFENFQIQIGQSPLLTSFATFIAYSVISIEIAVCFFLAYPKTKGIGLLASLALMSAFTVYIFIILNYSDYVPCSCGGVLEEMTWAQHLVFNIFCVLLSLTAILVMRKKRQAIAPILISIILPSGIVISLYFSSERIFKNENNFTRRYFPNALIEVNRVILDHPFYYFAGTHSDSIFWETSLHPSELKFSHPT